MYTANFIIILYWEHIAWAGFELTQSEVIGTDAQIVGKPTNIRTRPRRHLYSKVYLSISAYHLWWCEFEPHSGNAHSIQYCDKVCQWLAAGLWFSSGTPVSSTINTDRHEPRYNWNIFESGVKHHNPIIK